VYQGLDGDEREYDPREAHGTLAHELAVPALERLPKEK
jgi:hypothetical protein